MNLAVADIWAVALTKLQSRFTKLDPKSAHEFITASRSVKPGLICCVSHADVQGKVTKTYNIMKGIVSAWTWSATLLQSSVATYADGLSAAWWYGVGGTVQVRRESMCSSD